MEESEQQQEFEQSWKNKPPSSSSSSSFFRQATTRRRPKWNFVGRLLFNKVQGLNNKNTNNNKKDPSASNSRRRRRRKANRRRSSKSDIVNDHHDHEDQRTDEEHTDYWSSSPTQCLEESFMSDMGGGLGLQQQQDQEAEGLTDGSCLVVDHQLGEVDNEPSTEVAVDPTSRLEVTIVEDHYTLTTAVSAVDGTTTTAKHNAPNSPEKPSSSTHESRIGVCRTSPARSHYSQEFNVDLGTEVVLFDEQQQKQQNPQQQHARGFFSKNRGDVNGGGLMTGGGTRDADSDSISVIGSHQSFRRTSRHSPPLVSESSESLQRQTSQAPSHRRSIPGGAASALATGARSADERAEARAAASASAAPGVVSSNQTHQSDSLVTWVSHDKECELSDKRPVREICFPTPHDIQSLEGCDRDAIFATIVGQADSTTTDNEVHKTKQEEGEDECVSATYRSSQRGAQQESVGESLKNTGDRVDSLLETISKQAEEMSEQDHQQQGDEEDNNDRGHFPRSSSISTAERVFEAIRQVGSEALADVASSKSFVEVSKLTRNSSHLFDNACGTDMNNFPFINKQAVVPPVTGGGNRPLADVLEDEDDDDYSDEEEEDSLLNSAGSDTQQPSLPTAAYSSGDDDVAASHKLSSYNNSTINTISTRQYYRYPRRGTGLSPPPPPRVLVGGAMSRAMSNTSTVDGGGDDVSTLMSGSLMTMSQASTTRTAGDDSTAATAEEDSVRTSLFAELRTELVEAVEDIARVSTLYFSPSPPKKRK